MLLQFKNGPHSRRQQMTKLREMAEKEAMRNYGKA